MDAETPSFGFTIQDLAADTFQVVHFKGQEGLSQLYEFDILLASPRTDVDLDAVRSGRARLTMRRPGRQDLMVNGIIRDFDQMEQNHGYTFYRAVIVPRAWWLTQVSTTQIFLDDEMHHILEEVLKGAGLLSGLDFEFRLAVTYPRRDWVCQYDETHWNFFNRLMERGGLYFFFEQTPGGEKLVVTDSALAHVPLPGEEGLKYRSPSALDTPEGLETARSFRCCLRQMPREVLIRDYNYRNLAQVEGRHGVSETGVATLYRHVEDLRSNAEARYVAKARAEGLACRGKLFHGETAAPFLRPGYSFALTGHFRQDFNQQYTTIELKHEGHQESYIVTDGKQARQDNPFYRNTFTAIPAPVQFRPEPKTPRPVVGGPVTAWIDGEGDGRYAEVDALGRYKVRFPFDLSGRQDGKASHWIRMLTPYGGAGHGLHLPLHKGTEVLVSFRDGNPDKPVIAGAVPNQYQKMMVTEDNKTWGRLHTAGGNTMLLEDLEGKQAIHFSTPTHDTVFTMGPLPVPAGGDPGGGQGGSGTEDGITLYTTGGMSVKCQTFAAVTLGAYADTTVGARAETTLGESLDLRFVLYQDFCIGHKAVFERWKSVLCEKESQAKGQVSTFIGKQHDNVTEKIVVAMQKKEYNDEHHLISGEGVFIFDKMKKIHAHADVDIEVLNEKIARKNCVMGKIEEVAEEQEIDVIELNLNAENLKELFGNKSQIFNEKNEVGVESSSMLENHSLMSEASDELVGSKNIL